MSLEGFFKKKIDEEIDKKLKETLKILYLVSGETNTS